MLHTFRMRWSLKQSRWPLPWESPYWPPHPQFTEEQTGPGEGRDKLGLQLVAFPRLQGACVLPSQPSPAPVPVLPLSVPPWALMAPHCSRPLPASDTASHKEQTQQPGLLVWHQPQCLPRALISASNLLCQVPRAISARRFIETKQVFLQTLGWAASAPGHLGQPGLGLLGGGALWAVLLSPGRAQRLASVELLYFCSLILTLVRYTYNLPF